MASYVKPSDRKGPGEEVGEAAPVHRIRITLTSTKVLGRLGWALGRPAGRHACCWSCPGAALDC